MSVMVTMVKMMTPVMLVMLVTMVMTVRMMMLVMVINMLQTTIITFLGSDLLDVCVITLGDCSLQLHAR